MLQNLLGEWLQSVFFWVIIVIAVVGILYGITRHGK